MAALFRVKALYDYSSPHEDDLNFDLGQVIAVTDEDDEDWYGGEYVDADGVKKEGIFPRNFVEKIEPTAPPRPARTRTKKEAEAPKSPEQASAPPPQPPTATSEPEPAPAPGPEPEPEIQEPEAPVAKSPPPQPAAAPVPGPPKPVEHPAQTPAPPVPAAKSNEPAAATSPQSSKPNPPGTPPVTEKPKSNSFKDRIAAFNKPAAPPIAPFKPSGLSAGGGGGGVGFIKKPFVAAPPSRNAYVPPPQQAPVSKIYRRDEDPEIKEREAENKDQAEKAGLAPGEDVGAAEDEDQPKPTTLKERIALLQQQQREQAQRHADSAAKKEKPKKPPKKPTEAAPAPEEEVAETEEPAPFVPPLPGRMSIDESARRTSTDDGASFAPPPSRRKSSKGHPAESIHDGNEADMSGAGDTTEGQDDTTEREDNDEPSRPVPRASVVSSSAPGLPPRDTTEQTQSASEVEKEEDEEDEEEEEVDPEVKRKEELRARMAKMSGGMGFHGMFGMPVPAAGAGSSKKKKSSASAPVEEEPEEATPVPQAAPPVPTLMALPGMGGPRKSEEAARAEENEPVPAARAPPPPVPARQLGDELEAEEDDETTPSLTPAPTAGLPLLLSHQKHARLLRPLRPLFIHQQKALCLMMSSRQPPKAPIVLVLQLLCRLACPLSRRKLQICRFALRPFRLGLKMLHLHLPRRRQAGEENEGEASEYEGDYDTDIASSAPHKDALKAHARDSSQEENSLQSPTEVPQAIPPPIPTSPPPRAIPPPIPTQPPPPPESKRRSVDFARAAPPPPPPTKDLPSPSPAQEEYDPYGYSGATPGYSHKTPKIEEEAYFPDAQPGQSPPERRAPPHTPGGRGRPSLDVGRKSMSNRRSMDIQRPTGESEFIATDIDLAVQSGWFKQANQVPPVLQGRRDIFFECDESTTTNQGAKAIITREIWILFQDYSQTILTARYDPYDASNVELDQRHEPPPRPLRQDQMEDYYERFGRPISEMASAKKDTVVADGTPAGLVLELLRPFKDALRPVGTRSYGALVYSNMANASTQQNDMIRPGDIMSIRNARFQGKHGAMHAKYSMEVGKPDHVAVVAEWDGTKKKVRAWEQGRESKKVKMESFKLDDLRSGEVKIWRVMPRSWVGWNTQA
ncbi:assembly of actin patch protein [Amphichorda felina]